MIPKTANDNSWIAIYHDNGYKWLQEKNIVLQRTAKTNDGNIIIMRSENIFVHMLCQNAVDVWYKAA